MPYDVRTAYVLRLAGLHGRQEDVTDTVLAYNVRRKGSFGADFGRMYFCLSATPLTDVVHVNCDGH